MNLTIVWGGSLCAYFKAGAHVWPFEGVVLTAFCGRGKLNLLLHNRSPQNNEHLLSHTVSLGQGSGMGLARWFWLRVWHGCSHRKAWLGAQISFHVAHGGRDCAGCWQGLTMGASPEGWLSVLMTSRLALLRVSDSREGRTEAMMFSAT